MPVVVRFFSPALPDGCGLFNGLRCKSLVDALFLVRRGAVVPLIDRSVASDCGCGRESAARRTGGDAAERGHELGSAALFDEHCFHLSPVSSHVASKIHRPTVLHSSCSSAAIAWLRLLL